MPDALPVPREGATEQVECGVVEERCACILPPHHDGPHACGCGGVYDDNAKVVYHFPIREGLFTQVEAIAHQARCVEKGPASAYDVIVAMFGSFDDDDDEEATP